MSLLVLIKIISGVISIFIFVPVFMFIAYLFFDQYNKFYLRLVGQGNRWYQNLFIIPAGLFFYFKRKYIRKNMKKGPLENHIAIVIADNYFPENICCFGLDNAIKLIKYLKKHNKNYRVYNKITFKKLKKVIYDKNVKSIFLFGHGERHGIKVGRNELVYYCEFPNHPKKHLIAQFHCNHFKGKPLSEYAKEKPLYNFVTDNLQNHKKINKQINEMIKKGLIK